MNAFGKSYFVMFGKGFLMQLGTKVLRIVLDNCHTLNAFDKSHSAMFGKEFLMFL